MGGGDFCSGSHYFVFCRHFSVSRAASFQKEITVRQDRITYSTLIPSPSLMQQKRVTAELSQTSFCSHSKLARLLALPSRIRIRQWPLCKVSLSDFCCLCESKSAYFNNKAGLASPTLLFPWRSVKYRCLLTYALPCSGWDNVLYFS